MKNTSILLSLLMSFALLMSSCEQGTSVQTDFDAIPPPPRASTLREIVRIRAKASLIKNPTLTQDGVYYADADGIFRISVSGENKLFIAWDQIPEFWKSWQETQKSENGNSSLPPIYAMTDGSILVGDVERQWGENASGSLLTFQHISKSGIPLKHIQSYISEYLSAGTELVGLDETRVLMQVHGLYIGQELNAILDLGRGTYQRLEKVSPTLRNPDAFRVIGKRIFSFTRNHPSDEKGAPWVVVFNFDGKVDEKESFENFLGISPWNKETDIFSGFVVSGGKVGLWIHRTLEGERPYQGMCTLFLINPEKLSSSNVSLVYQAKGVSGSDCSSSTNTWLGGRSFAKNAEGGVELGTLTQQGFIKADTWMWDWRFEARRLDRTQDGSLTAFEIAKDKNGQSSRLLLINPDGRLRLSHTFTFDGHTPRRWGADFSMLGNYVLIFGDGNEILFYKIENASN